MDISILDSMNGLEFEEFICDAFHNMGWYAANTNINDYGTDLLVHMFSKLHAIQIKHTRSKPIGVEAVQQAIGGKMYYDADQAYVLTNGTFTNQAKELASRLNVILLDREYCMKLCQALLNTTPFTYVFGAYVNKNENCEETLRDSYLTNIIRFLNTMVDDIHSSNLHCKKFVICAHPINGSAGEYGKQHKHRANVFGKSMVLVKAHEYAQLLSQHGRYCDIGIFEMALYNNFQYSKKRPHYALVLAPKNYEFEGEYYTVFDKTELERLVPNIKSVY